MSIKIQVDDAMFLASNDRYLGALTNLMLAVAASSRKTFPKGKAKSLKDPSKKMGDGEAFTLFLGGRIRKLLFGDFGGPDSGSSGINVNFKGKQYDIAYILYKFYRCELIHEGELPEDIEFTHSNQNINMSNNGLSVSISCGNTMILDHGWIDLLINAVVSARCNGSLFGVRHFDLIPCDGVDESAFCETLVSKHGITPGPYHILKQAVRHITPKTCVQGSDEEIQGRFLELVTSNIFNGGAIAGLYCDELSDREGNLPPKGLEIVREIAGAYKIVEV